MSSISVEGKLKQELDAGNWITNTGKMLCHEEDLVQVEFPDGAITNVDGQRAGNWWWDARCGAGAIVKYRVVKRFVKATTEISPEFTLIGITGKAGSGKDTVADYLVEKYGYTKVSFAAILKKMLAAAGLPEPTNRDDKERVVEGLDFTWRHAAQTLGTEWGRKCLQDDIWVQLTMKSLVEDKRYVISDVRFDNEGQAVRIAGGTVLHLVGREADLGNAAAHASECGIPAGLKDYQISNYSNKEFLFEEVEQMLGSK